MELGPPPRLQQSRMEPYPTETSMRLTGKGPHDSNGKSSKRVGDKPQNADWRCYPCSVSVARMRILVVGVGFAWNCRLEDIASQAVQCLEMTVGRVLKEKRRAGAAEEIRPAAGRMA